MYSIIESQVDEQEFISGQLECTQKYITYFEFIADCKNS